MSRVFSVGGAALPGEPLSYLKFILTVGGKNDKTKTNFLKNILF